MEDDFKVPQLFPQKPPPSTLEEPSEDSPPAKKPEVPYKIPAWNGPKSEKPYSFEILKQGVIVDVIKNLQSKSFWMIGRLAESAGVDITSAHPTTSRYHAVFQYKEPKVDEEDEKDVEAEGGWFIYDLDSTHGTFLNKMRVKPRTYVRVRVGHQLKFGNSTRNFILAGPSEDEEEASELTITEIKEQRKLREAEMLQKQLEQKAELEKKKKEEEEAGISWGMAEDAEEEPDLTENPFAQTNNEELFLDDPKKTLRGFFEREGYDLDYRCDELSPGTFVCRVELPIDDEFGKSVVCEVQHKGKKKECVVQCALEACRILDRHGVLRQANHEPRRSRKAQDSDDSDDDNFFDRTGDVEKKRLKKAGQAPSEAMTYEQLVEKEKEVQNNLMTKEKQLTQMVEQEKRLKMQNDDDLDSFMSNLSSLNEKVDKFAISHLKNEIQQLRIELQKTQKLVNIAKPSITLPPVNVAKSKLPLFGKRNVLGRNFGVKQAAATTTVKKVDDFKVEEDDEDVVESEKTKIELEEAKKSEKPESTEKDDEPVVKKAKLDEPTQNMEVDSPQETSDSHKKSPPKEEKPTKLSRLEEISTKSEIKLSDEKKETETKPSTSNPSPTEPSSETSAEAASKKKKNRIRIRNRLRENIDINDDDEYIDEEKVSTWVAPEGQSGDGVTHLNAKFGY